MKRLLSCFLTLSIALGPFTEVASALGGLGVPYIPPTHPHVTWETQALTHAAYWMKRLDSQKISRGSIRWTLSQWKLGWLRSLRQRRPAGMPNVVGWLKEIGYRSAFLLTGVGGGAWGPSTTVEDDLPRELRAQLQRPIGLMITDLDKSLNPHDQPTEPESRALLDEWARTVPDVQFGFITLAGLDRVFKNSTQLYTLEVQKRSFVYAAVGYGYGPDGQQTYERTFPTTMGADAFQALHRTVSEAASDPNALPYGNPTVVDIRPAKISVDFPLEMPHLHEAIEHLARVIESHLDPAYKGQVQVLRSGAAVDVCVTTKIAPLQHLIAQIASERGVSEEEIYPQTVVFGDSQGDLAMLNEVATRGGVAVFLGSKVPQAIHPNVVLMPEHLQGPAGWRAAARAHLEWAQREMRSTQAGTDIVSEPSLDGLTAILPFGLPLPLMMGIWNWTVRRWRSREYPAIAETLLRAA